MKHGARAVVWSTLPDQTSRFSTLLDGTRTPRPIPPRHSTHLCSRVAFQANFDAHHSRPRPAPTHRYQPWHAPGWWPLGVSASQLAQANPRYSDLTCVEGTLTNLSHLSF